MFESVVAFMVLRKVTERLLEDIKELLHVSVRTAECWVHVFPIRPLHFPHALFHLIVADIPREWRITVVGDECTKGHRFILKRSAYWFKQYKASDYLRFLVRRIRIGKVEYLRGKPEIKIASVKKGNNGAESIS